ncbi:MAG TPA: type VI secretion system contractile sheath large subunit [Phycisphaerales bacterium]|jgi:type VI secretion system protein ImpC|nr:type VI secretion system contractile sheath large subunit [Phycisphaerales bacterium]
MSQAETQGAGFLDAVKHGDVTIREKLGKTVGTKNAEKVKETEEGMEALIKVLLGEGFQPDKSNFRKTIQKAKAAIDARLAAQINEILHNEAFQKLESAWRGLHYLCQNTATDETLKIKVLNCPRQELYDNLESNSGAMWDKSELYKKLHRDQFSQPGGEPFGALIGDYYFDHSHQDVQMLQWISGVCASCHCPFISAVNPSVMGLDSWEELQDLDNVSLQLDSKKHAAWKDLRKSEDSRFLALTMPRFLARMPYGDKGQKVNAFAFEEDVAGAKHDRFVWGNAAYAMGVNITRAFRESGWTVQIRGKEAGGEVQNLPVYTFETSDGDVDAKCPTEVPIDQRREAELSNNGLMPLVWWKGEPNAAFVGGQTLREAEKWSTSEANSNEKLGTRLPYIFACSRFAHFLKKMCYDKIGAIKRDGEDWSSAVGVKNTLQKWINMYVEPNPGMVSMEQLAEKPLAAAEVVVNADPDDPGVYDAQFFLRPHFQLEGVNVALSLAAKLPSQAG